MTIEAFWYLFNVLFDCDKGLKSKKDQDDGNNNNWQYFGLFFAFGNSENSGGSHLIAQAVTDLYGSGFRSTLVEWLKSIPHYPKPFDMVFEPITTLLYRMLTDLVDGECYKTCIVDKARDLN